MRVGKHVAVVLGLLIVAMPSFAGIGIHVNMDQTTIPEATNAFTFEGDPGGYAPTTLTRTESGAPIGIGVDLTLNILPIFDFQVSVEAAFATYDAVFTPAPQSGQPVVSEEGLPYARIGADLSVLYNVFKMPVGRVFIGAGPSLGVFAPVFSEELVLDNVQSADEEVDPVDLVSTEFKFGFHIIAGVGIKPPVFPLGARIYIKHYIMSGVDEPAPSSWTTLGLGVYLGG
ncbi:hypothetical protein KQI63_01525 [bacterium]|nr:hypothetical protein [bacterium]